MPIDKSFRDAVNAVASIIEDFEKKGHVPLDQVKKAFDGWQCQDDSEEDWCFSTQGITVYFDEPNRIFVEFCFADDEQLTESVDGKWHSVVYLSSLKNPRTIMYHLKGPPTPGSEFEKALGYSVSSDDEEFGRVVIHAIHLPDCKMACIHGALGLLEISH